MSPLIEHMTRTGSGEDRKSVNYRILSKTAYLLVGLRTTV